MTVLIVTGGSRGIGAAVCRLAATQGYFVVINYMSGDAAADEVRTGIEAAGGKAVTVAGDMSDEAHVRRVFDTAAEHGRIAGVVNNAGITGNTPGRLDEQDVQTVRRVLDVNVLGVFLCAREAVRQMSTRYGGGGGAIVNVSSTAAGRGSPGEWVHYAASKAAVDSLTHGLALEVAAEGIRVNAVAPGLVETGLHAAAGMPDRPARGDRRGHRLAALTGRVVRDRRGAADQRRAVGLQTSRAQRTSWMPSGSRRAITSVPGADCSSLIGENVTPCSVSRSVHSRRHSLLGTLNDRWSNPGRRSSNSVRSASGCCTSVSVMPNPGPRRKTLRCPASASSRPIVENPSTRSYHGTLRSTSVTVSATW
jgi:NAD(P)-dependent dehydrogenase (short-subunit alcohol dehydrogenase family)